MADDSFGFTKDTEAISRRPSFSNTLQEVLSAGEKKGNGFLHKKSSTGRWNKRWFIVHGHYLSYYRHDPAMKKEAPLGALDLWHVEGVSLDDCTLTLRLSHHALQGRLEEMGGETAKKIIGANPLAKSLAKRVDNARRTNAAGSDFALKASTPQEAQIWLTRMRESPLMGSLAMLQKALNQEEQPLVVKELRFTFGAREFIFADVSNMFDGLTDILLRDIPERGSSLIVIIGTKEKTTIEGKSLFEPSLQDASGTVRVEFPAGVKVDVDWERKYASALEKAPVLLGSFSVCFLVVLILSRRVVISLVLAAVVAGTLGGLLFQKGRNQNNIIIRKVAVVKADVISPPPSPKGGKKKNSKIPIKLGISKDPHITPEEAGMIEVLRERTKDMWNVQPDADAFMKKYEKFFKEWHSDMTAVKNPAKIKLVMDKHINEDFRIVRFLRARKHDVNKAEVMLRDSLTWRIVLGSDEIANDPELATVPPWLLQYFGSPRNIAIVKNQQDRIARFYQRDKEGHLAMFIRAGRLTSRKIFKKMCSKPCFMIKYLVRAVEICRLDLEKHREQTNGQVETVMSLIIDLDGFAVSEQLPIVDLVALARRFFPIFATGFPELLCRVLVFNAPWLFGTLWSAVKPFIPEEVQEKIQIHSGEIKFDKHIRPYFTEEYIPKYFGGKMVDEEDGNEFCLTKVVPYAPYALPQEGAKLFEGIDSQAQTW